jgi:hypothetical protein
VPAHEDPALRSAVHEKLGELLLDDALGFGVEVVTVGGDVGARVAQVLERVR